ncbi:flagellar attachment zone protein 1-like isoform X2 [Paramacrobiotus metropolitanus]|uniref:flagellar attachment zone protein 1-like isoform X2 n=1 Tax=Paramacrobiotus metropolitanus TaxID=2943436 RepID=UPI0024459548|nr:flagellar attachment zone protein 1-like isoform X2 [Paramacrobiotus metropolitanus]
MHQVSAIFHQGAEDAHVATAHLHHVLQHAHQQLEPPKQASATLLPVKTLSELEYYSQSAIFHDLHPVEQKLDLTLAYAAVEQAFDKRFLSYSQAANLRNKISVLLDIYGQRFKFQKNLQELVTGQVRYYQDHFEEVHEAENLPWLMKQQLQGLRGDAQRLNEELIRSKAHLEQLEQEIHRLDNEKKHLNDALEIIPTANEYQQFVQLMNIDQENAQQQLDKYKLVINRTEESKRSNEAAIVRLHARCQMVSEEVAIKHKELSVITNKIPHIHKECGALQSELQRCTEELHLLNVARHKLEHSMKTLIEVAAELANDIAAATAEKVSLEILTEHRLYDFHELLKSVEMYDATEMHHRAEKAALECELANVIATCKTLQTNRLQILRERDHLTLKKVNLENEIRRLRNGNANERENMQRLEKKFDEKEERITDYREDLKTVEGDVSQYGVQTQAKKEAVSTLRRTKRDRKRRMFFSFVEYKQKSKELRKLRDEKYKMEAHQRIFNSEWSKLRQKLSSLNEEYEYKRVSLRFLESVTLGKRDRLADLQEQGLQTEKERQRFDDLSRVVKGFVHQNKDRTMYIEDELRQVEQTYRKVELNLERIAVERKREMVALQQLEKAHFSEKLVLKELEDKYEREFTKVLLLRRELDVNLLHCEMFTDTFEVISELRACEAALFIDVTTQFMLRLMEKNQIEKHTHETDLKHRALDGCITWLQKTAETDIKLLYKRLKWRSSLMEICVSTRDNLNRELVATSLRRMQLINRVVGVREKEFLQQIQMRLTDEEVQDLIRKEEQFVVSRLAGENGPKEL